jgi:hypothetical protein
MEDQVYIMEETTYRTRLEHILGVPLAEDIVRQWPQILDRRVGCNRGGAESR